LRLVNKFAYLYLETALKQRTLLLKYGAHIKYGKLQVHWLFKGFRPIKARWVWMGFALQTATFHTFVQVGHLEVIKKKPGKLNSHLNWAN